MHCNHFLLLQKPVLYLLCQAYEFDQLVKVDLSPVKVEHDLYKERKRNDFVAHSQIEQRRQKIHALCIPDLRVELTVSHQHIIDRIFARLYRDVANLLLLFSLKNTGCTWHIFFYLDNCVTQVI